MAADCLALLDALGLDQVHVLGHSMGGMVAVQMAAQWPERLDRLVVSASQPNQSARTDSLLDTLIALHEARVPDELWFKTLFHWLMAPAGIAKLLAADCASLAEAGSRHHFCGVAGP